jgi:F-type H+-transporting ATPase subunit epsilon
MNKFTAILLTPDKKFFEEDIEFIVIPGEAGELGIYAGHQELITMIKPGMVKIIDGTEVKKLNVAAGIAYITQNSVKILSPVIRWAEREV